MGGEDTKSVAAVEDLRGFSIEALRHEKDIESLMGSSIIVGVKVDHAV